MGGSQSAAMKLRLERGLIYVSVTLIHQGKTLSLGRMIVDTGSAGTIFAVESIEPLDFEPPGESTLHEVFGIGGSELVYRMPLDAVTLDETMSAVNFPVEVGAMDYGLDIDGIIGTDFLMQVGAVIDMAKLEVRTARKSARKS